MRVSRFVVSALSVVTLLLAAPAVAQVCDFPLCAAGSSFASGGTDSSGPYGVCNSCDWWGFCAHELDHCPAGSSLNELTGECTWNLCTSGCGGELPLCNSTETFAGTFVDAAGKTYGSCQTGPSYPGGPISHRLEYCRAGWTLTSTGQCFKNCLADLVIGATYLRDSTGAWVSSVHSGQKYRLCSLVKNVGTAWAGPSWVVSGGGLAIPYSPSVTMGWLAPGSYVEACLDYYTSPSPGTYHVGVSADSTGLIPEYDDSNNGMTATVTVVP